MKRLHSLSGLVALYFGIALSAAEPKAAVPEDLVRYFVGGDRMYGELPADFPAFGMPDGLRS